MDADVARWLTTAEAGELLERCSGAAPTPAAVAALRKAVSAERAAAVFEQVELRRRAVAKFRDPERMLFTRKGLEQATDQWVAEYKAERFAAAVGDGGVADLCCGVGGDLVGLRAKGVGATGVDNDPASACFAEWNSRGEVLCGDAAGVSLEDYAAWHCDPDRRAGGARTTRPELHAPSLETLQRWRERNGTAAIKLAPAARLDEPWEAGCELEWISTRGECRQLVAWCGALAAAPGRRRATRVSADGEPASVVGEPDAGAPRVGAVGEFVFEPDAAVLAAGLGGAVAQRHGLAAFSGCAYLTGDRVVEDPLLAGFVVEDVGALSRERLREWLAARGVGRLEIKVRGVRVDPERLRKELRPRGDDARTLLVAPDPAKGGEKPMAIVARRCVGPVTDV